MPTTVPLPDGQHALMRDPKQVSQRQRRPFERIKAEFAVTVNLSELENQDLPESEKAMTLTRELIKAGKYELADEMNDAMILMFVESWSFEGPVNQDALIDLPGPAYDALQEWCTPQLDKVFLREGYDKEDKAKTGPTGASAG